MPRADDECRPALIAQHPDLEHVDTPAWDFKGFSPEEALAVVTEWVETELIPRYGATRTVRRLDPVDHTSIDPVSELRMMRPDATIVVVNPTDSSDR
ncbi:MAG: hypothetical protein PGN07_04695 [Aeromicrobium erythreum]